MTITTTSATAILSGICVFWIILSALGLITLPLWKNHAWKAENSIMKFLTFMGVVCAITVWTVYFMTL